MAPEEKEWINFLKENNPELLQKYLEWKEKTSPELDDNFINFITSSLQNKMAHDLDEYNRALRRSIFGPNEPVGVIEGISEILD